MIMNEKKMIHKFIETSFIISSEIKKFPILAVLRKTVLIGKYSNFNFQNRGCSIKKNPFFLSIKKNSFFFD